jgi:hypothetical protein
MRTGKAWIAAAATLAALVLAPFSATTLRADDATAPAAASTVPLPEFELGYRFVKVSGNEDEYRSQINDRDGFVLRSLTWASTAPIGPLDYFRVDADSIGAGSDGSLRFSAGQVDRFRLDFTWRRAELFSALPAFANPLLDDGIVPGQHTYDRSRDVYDVTLQILPGQTLTPILGFTRNIFRGPGTTTFHVGENDFLLNEGLRAIDDEYRVGLAFNTSIVQGAVMQGYRQYRLRDVVSLVPGAGSGNVDFPILGQNVTADGIDRTTNSKTNSPVTNVWITGHPLDKLTLTGSYIRADQNASTDSAETDSGNFVSFQISRFFTGLDDAINSSAKTNYWRGSARADYEFGGGIGVTGGWTERSRELTGSALANSLYTDTATFGNVPTGDILQAVRSDTSLHRDDRTFDVSVQDRQLGPFAVNVGWSQTHQDVDFGGEFSSLLEPGVGPGEYDRTVNTWGGGFTLRCLGLTLGGDYRHDHADQLIFRSDFLSRDRYKFRVGWDWKETVHVGATYHETRSRDDEPAIDYRAVTREFTGDVSVDLFQHTVTIHGSGGELMVDRSILILQPQDFSIVPTAQDELGHTWEGGVTVSLKGFTLDGAYLWMGNEGSIPFSINRTRIRAEYFLTANLGLEGEWLRDKYLERFAFDQAGPLANFNANRYGIFVHWRP